MKEVKNILIIVVLCLLLFQPEGKSQDTTVVSAPAKEVRKFYPMKATMLSAAIPGGGQVYNRKFWKIPLVYAGFGALGYYVVLNSKNYNIYTKAYQDFVDKIPQTASYIPLIPGVDPARYDPVLYPDEYNTSDEAWVKDHLVRGIDYYRKYRDLSYIGIVFWYTLSILDANVDASLSDYDIGENINITFTPVQTQGFYYAHLGLNVSLKINF